jgi:hypothetical protein
LGRGGVTIFKALWFMVTTMQEERRVRDQRTSGNVLSASTFPPFHAHLHPSQILDLSENALKTFPDVLCSLTLLYDLNLSHNHFVRVPLSLGNPFSALKLTNLYHAPRMST